MKINPCVHKDQREYVFLVLDVYHFKVLMEFCYSIASVLCFAYLAPRHLSLLGSLLFDQGIELLPPAVKSEVLTSGRQGTPSKRIF